MNTARNRTHNGWNIANVRDHGTHHDSWAEEQERRETREVMQSPVMVQTNPISKAGESTAKNGFRELWQLVLPYPRG